MCDELSDCISMLTYQLIILYIHRNDSDESMIDPEDAIDALDGKLICTYCKGKLDKKKVPGISLLNNMLTGECPDELKKLNTIEMMFCRRVKCFQTVLKPGPISKKMPASDRLEAVKGRFIHLPLSTEATYKQLDESSDQSRALYNVEDYVLVYGIPR